MLDLNDPMVKVRVASVSCSSVAVVSTLCRLYIRRKRPWIDDAAALFSLLALVVQVAAVFINPQQGTNIGEIRYYIIALTFFAVLWSSRLSILFSLIRVNPFPEHQTKLKIIAVVFVIVPLLLILQCLLTCIPISEWKTMAIPTCALSDASAICQLVALLFNSLADILSDGILLFVPTRLLMILSDKNLRTRLILIFSTCIITSFIGLGHAIEIFNKVHTERVYTAIIENNIALIVCNTPVILTTVIDLKEAPWEERHFLHELRNLELSTLPPSSDEAEDHILTAPVLVSLGPLPLTDHDLEKPSDESG